MRLLLDFRVNHPAYKAQKTQIKALAKAMCLATLKVAPPAKTYKIAHLSLVLSTDEEVQKLNQQFRGKDKPTNVLSFPAGQGDEPGFLGDIILSLDTIAHEAELQGKEFKDHFAHLIAHGVLHLLGYDHENQEDAAKMEGLEVEILTESKIPNPYL